MIYVVKQGDTVDRIASENNVPVETLVYDNQIPDPYRLAIGQSLYLESTQTESEDKSFIYVNGYAYPFIQESILTQTLPYLTNVSIFSYGFTTDGSLIPPARDDQWIINAAWQGGVEPIMTLTPIDNTGTFNNELIHAVVNDVAARNELLEQVQTALEQKGFAELNIDFEYVLAEDRDAFSEFVEIATEKLNKFGYPVSVALAPKTSDSQKGIIYEGQDYRRLGAAANHVILMTYEWGYTYGPPMAVAPVDKVRTVVDYAVSQIDPEKINLGIPNYGYDWMLPFVRGSSRATTLGNIQAVQLAITQGVEIQFDETAQSPFFKYVEDGITHEVWFEDVRSVNAKFELVNEYGLRGVGYWQLMTFFRANWLLLNSIFQRY